MNLANRLSQIELPFSFWYESGQEIGMPEYSKENCDAAESAVVNLINWLIENAASASKEDVLLAFKSSVQSLNNLNKLFGLIETGEREELCDLFDEIAVEVGLDPKNYADGEGIATMWCEW